jgi:hypothetical protein
MQSVPEQADGLLHFHRRWGWQNLARKYNICVDSELIGELGVKDQIELRISSGEHTVSAEIDGYGSATETVIVEPSEWIDVLITPSKFIPRRSMLSSGYWLKLIITKSSDAPK